MQPSSHPPVSRSTSPSRPQYRPLRGIPLGVRKGSSGRGNARLAPRGTARRSGCKRHRPPGFKRLRPSEAPSRSSTRSPARFATAPRRYPFPRPVPVRMTMPTAPSPRSVAPTLLLRPRRSGPADALRRTPTRTCRPPVEVSSGCPPIHCWSRLARAPTTGCEPCPGLLRSRWATCQPTPSPRTGTPAPSSPSA